jgi:hypothetical protein
VWVVKLTVCDHHINPTILDRLDQPLDLLLLARGQEVKRGVG